MHWHFFLPSKFTTDFVKVRCSGRSENTRRRDRSDGSSVRWERLNEFWRFQIDSAQRSVSQKHLSVHQKFGSFLQLKSCEVIYLVYRLWRFVSDKTYGKHEKHGKLQCVEMWNDVCCFAGERHWSEHQEIGEARMIQSPRFRHYILYSNTFQQSFVINNDTSYN